MPASHNDIASCRSLSLCYGCCCCRCCRWLDPHHVIPSRDRDRHSFGRWPPALADSRIQPPAATWRARLCLYSPYSGLLRPGLGAWVVFLPSFHDNKASTSVDRSGYCVLFARRHLLALHSGSLSKFRIVSVTDRHSSEKLYNANSYPLISNYTFDNLSALNFETIMCLCVCTCVCWLVMSVFLSKSLHVLLATNQFIHGVHWRYCRTKHQKDAAML